MVKRFGGGVCCFVEGSIGKFLRLWERTCWQSSMVYQVAESCQGVSGVVGLGMEIFSAQAKVMLG